MNESGDYSFSCDYIRNCQFNVWFTEPKSKDLNACDYDKHCTSYLMGKILSCGWPVYYVFDEVKSYDGEIEACFYYINTKKKIYSKRQDGMILIQFIMHMNVN